MVVTPSDDRVLVAGEGSGEEDTDSREIGTEHEDDPVPGVSKIGMRKSPFANSAASVATCGLVDEITVNPKYVDGACRPRTWEDIEPDKSPQRSTVSMEAHQGPFGAMVGAPYVFDKQAQVQCDVFPQPSTK
ncbi:hypothetical protein U1Q18_009792 [Sarracenia purpurea var. burkii]